MMKLLGVLVLALLVASGASASGDKKTETKAMSYSGYVVDQMCGSGMAKKANAMDKAAAHTKDCALSASCAASGYGLFIKGKYHPFDSKGSGLAKAMLEKSTKADHMYAEVTGTMKGNTLNVTAIKEADAPASTPAPAPAK